jgi:hypothetical protein
VGSKTIHLISRRERERERERERMNEYDQGPTIPKHLKISHQAPPLKLSLPRDSPKLGTKPLTLGPFWPLLGTFKIQITAKFLFTFHSAKILNNRSPRE